MSILDAVSSETRAIIEALEEYGRYQMWLCKGMRLTDNVLKTLSALEQQFREACYPGLLGTATWLLRAYLRRDEVC